MRAALLTSTLIHAGAFAAALGLGVLAAGSEPARALWVTVPGASSAEVPGLEAADLPECGPSEAAPEPESSRAADADAERARTEAEASLEASAGFAPAPATEPPPCADAVAEARAARRDLDATALLARIRPPARSPAPLAVTAPAAPGGAPATPGSLAAEALASENVPPAYPPAARRAAQEGTVWLELEIDARGTVTQASVATSSGHPLLDAAALTSVRAWRYRPALEGGRAVASRLRQSVVFRLTEAP